MTLKPLIWILLLLTGLAAALWWNRDQPAVQRLLPALGIERTALPALSEVRPAAPPSGATLRKCRGSGPVLYTNGPCPPGSREEAADGGSLTVLPAAPVAPSATVAASVQTPLRRLAGQGGAPDQQERRVEQALNR